MRRFEIQEMISQSQHGVTYLAEDMETQRDELTEAIDDLRGQIKWGEKMIASMQQNRSAAE